MARIENADIEENKDYLYTKIFYLLIKGLIGGI